MDDSVHWLASRSRLQEFAPFLVQGARPYTEVLGYTAFGDLILQDPESGEIAFLLVETLGIERTDCYSIQELAGQLLRAQTVVDSVLRPGLVASLQARLGALREFEIYFPALIPQLGGSGHESTYHRGGIVEHLAIVSQSIGCSGDRGDAL
jgi:hypothetical protein